MIGEDAQRDELFELGGGRIDAGQLRRRGLQREEFVGVPHRVDALEHRDGALETHAGVDRRLRQRHFRTVGLLVELHEHEIPDLDEAVLVAMLGAAVGAELGTLVPEDLRARAAGADVAHLPVVVLVEALNAVGRNTHLVLPDVGGLVVGEVDGDPETIGGQPDDLGDELPRPGARVFLEVVAEREVAHHLEEGQMPFRASDLVEVVVLAAGTNTLLHRDGARERRRLLSGEVGLERHHPGHGEEQRRVVRDQRRRRLVAVGALDEEVGERLADLIRLHRSGLRTHEAASLSAALCRKTGFSRCGSRGEDGSSASPDQGDPSDEPDRCAAPRRRRTQPGGRPSPLASP